jgi:hypothetical protein
MRVREGQVVGKCICWRWGWYTSTGAWIYTKYVRIDRIEHINILQTRSMSRYVGADVIGYVDILEYVRILGWFEDINILSTKCWNCVTTFFTSQTLCSYLLLMETKFQEQPQVKGLNGYLR